MFVEDINIVGIFRVDCRETKAFMIEYAEKLRERLIEALLNEVVAENLRHE